MSIDPNNADNTRDIILIRARELFLSLGYHRTSMRNIAQAAGISTGPLYFHFHNKAEIFFHICLQGYNRLLRDFRAVAAEDISAGIRLRNIFYAYWNFFHSEPEFFQILRLPDNPLAGIDLPQSFQSELNEKRQETIAVMEDLICSGIASAELKAFNPKALALFLFSIAEGVFQTHRSGMIESYDSSLEEIIATAVRVIGHGMVNER